MTSFRIQSATTVIVGKERTGPLMLGLRHDISIEARNLNEIGYGARAVIRGAQPCFRPATPIQVFATNPQSRSCSVLWFMGNNAPQFGPTDFYRIQVIPTKRPHLAYFYPSVYSEKDTSAVIMNLWAGTTYTFVVFAGNKAGLDDRAGNLSLLSVTLASVPAPAFLLKYMTAGELNHYSSLPVWYRSELD